MNRRTYPVNLIINKVKIKTVVIDPHYELKHSKSINDEIILRLVNMLHHGDFSPDSSTKDFEYYTNDLKLEDKKYRLIWLISKSEIMIGVVNAYRRK